MKIYLIKAYLLKCIDPILANDPDIVIKTNQEPNVVWYVNLAGPWFGTNTTVAKNPAVRSTISLCLDHKLTFGSNYTNIKEAQNHKQLPLLLLRTGITYETHIAHVAASLRINVGCLSMWSSNPVQGCFVQTTAKKVCSYQRSSGGGTLQSQGDCLGEVPWL